jgi:uncharacterized protein YggE
MKHVPTLVNAGLCCILIFILFAFGLPNTRAQAEQVTPTVQASEAAKPACDTTRTVQVSGTAVVNVVPDRVLIQLGVQSNATSINTVQLANTAAIKKVLAILESMSIASKDISTDRYVIEPVYESYDSLNIKGYRINNNIAITLRDVSKSSDVMAAALGAGANQVINVEFYTSELRKYRDQARDMAIKAAQEKAQALAKGVGAEASCVIHINENTWSSYYGGWYGRNQNLSSQNVSQNVAPAAGGSLTDNGPVSLGQISVQATVDVTFSLK